ITAGIASGASYAYNTVASGASATYNSAAGLAGSVTGSNRSDGDIQASKIDKNTSQHQGSTEEAEGSNNPESNDVPERDNHDSEREKGPSDSDRVDKAQSQIGTESGISTTAGAGTTVSPDDDVKEAIEKETSNRKDKSAAVGQDFSDQPCPTADAARDQPTSKPAEGKMQFDDQGEKQHGNADAVVEGQNDGSSNADQDDGDAGQDGGNTSGGLGTKLKNKVKGEAMVIAGKVKKDSEKVEAGKALKAG
ncbi:hypothetical protein BCV70DRAFT_142798, partial [Testicularia cyperi]